MKRVLAVLTTIAVSFMVAGCFETLQRNTDHLITPADYLMTDCDIPAPPTAQEFLEAQGDIAKYKLFTDAVDSYITVLGKCNIRTGELRGWVADQKALYESVQKK
jgi:hypothetical protein